MTRLSLNHKTRVYDVARAICRAMNIDSVHISVAEAAIAAIGTAHAQSDTKLNVSSEVTHKFDTSEYISINDGVRMISSGISVPLLNERAFNDAFEENKAYKSDLDHRWLYNFVSYYESAKSTSATKPVSVNDCADIIREMRTNFDAEDIAKAVLAAAGVFYVD